MGRQIPSADGIGLVRKADQRPRRSAAANFGAPLPSVGGAKGTKPTTEADNPPGCAGGNEDARHNECTEETMMMLMFARSHFNVMPGLVPGIHALLCVKEGVDGRDIG